MVATASDYPVAPSGGSRLPAPALRCDLLLGLGFAVVAELELVLADPKEIEGDVLGHHLLNLLVVVGVGLRRVLPPGAVAAVALGFGIQPLVGSAPLATPYLAVLFVLASFGWYAYLRMGILLVLVVLVCGIGIDAATHEVRAADIVVNAVIVVAAWAAVHALRRATDRRVRVELDADRAARAAVEAERTRIAQDPHDSLAHALTLMVLQAGSARERTREPVATDAFTAIERGGREALADMHRFLGLLGPRDGEAPGIRDLDDLVAGARRGGVDVELQLDRDVVCTLPPSAATAVYRVVQEGLTNVVRHSDAATARVAVQRCGNDVVVRVSDTGRSTPPKTAGGGRGLTGLARRLALYGGSVTSAAQPDGWCLEARLPATKEPG